MTAESVFASFFIKISEEAQTNEETRTKSPPKFKDKSGRKTHITPMKPRIRLIKRCVVNFSFKKMMANITVNIGAVKFNAVAKERGEILSP